MSAGDLADGVDGGVPDSTVVDLVDLFAVVADPRDQRWVEHPLAVVLA